MAFLSGAFRIDPKTDAFPGGLCSFSESFQLSRRVEDNVVCVLQQFFKVPFGVRAAKYMDFFVWNFFLSQTGLVKTTGFRSGQIRGQGRVKVKVGKGFLGQKDLAAGSFHKMF